MPDSGHYTRDEVLRVLTGPMVETDLSGGGVMIVKGGVVGLGWSHREAAVDWWQEFTGLIARPMSPAGDAETVIDEPREEAPPAQ